MDERVRGFRRWWPSLISSLLAPALSGLLLTPPASAQVALDDSIPLERMRLATDRYGLVSVEGGRVQRHLSWDVGAWVGWSANPLILYRVGDGQRMGSFVSNRLGSSVVGSVGLLGWGQIGFELPVVLFQDRRLGSEILTGEPPALSSLGLGNLRLVPKAQLLNTEDHGVDLAVLAGFTVPMGNGGAFLGDDGFGFQPEVALSRSFGALRVAGNLGAALRRTHTLLNIQVQSELSAQVAAGYRLDGPDGPGLPMELALALSGNIAAGRPLALRDESALEMRGMATYDVSKPVQVFLGGGLGLSRGWGTPDWRLFAGVRTHGVLEFPAPVVAAVAAPVDSDGDGMIDEEDMCPRQAEDMDGFEDSDGCPDDDNDKDGVADASDTCPLQAEDVDGFEDSDGCPDDDNDKDGLADAQDACALEAGPVENEGCPDKDKDGDTVVDRLDECPDVPGPVDNKGCARNAKVKLVGSRIEFEGVIHFDTAKDVIQQRSFELLDGVLTVIKAHPELGRIRVEGHTDSQGRLEMNMDLSQRRAQSVVRYLVERGIEEQRLLPEGFGPNRPVADNGTPEGRAQNRRVEFHIVADPNAAPEQSGDTATRGEN